MPKIVYDASAIIALMNRETRFERVLDYLESSQNFMSAVNYEEVLSKASDWNQALQPVIQLIETLEIEIVELDQRRALASAQLRPLSKIKGLSLGDRACLATAIDLGASAITADRVWCELDLNINIHCIR